MFYMHMCMDDVLAMVLYVRRRKLYTHKVIHKSMIAMMKKFYSVVSHLSQLACVLIFV